MSEAFESCWAIVELMGHRQRPGFIAEVEVAGSKMLRIDIPADGGDITEFYGSSAIYSIRPASEEVCRDAAERWGNPRPLRPVGYRERPALTDEADEDDFDEEL